MFGWQCYTDCTSHNHILYAFRKCELEVWQVAQQSKILRPLTCSMEIFDGILFLSQTSAVCNGSCPSQRPQPNSLPFNFCLTCSILQPQQYQQTSLSENNPLKIKPRQDEQPNHLARRFEQHYHKLQSKYKPEVFRQRVDCNFIEIEPPDVGDCNTAERKNPQTFQAAGNSGETGQPCRKQRSAETILL